MTRTPRQILPPSLNGMPTLFFFVFKKKRFRENFRSFFFIDQEMNVSSSFVVTETHPSVRWRGAFFVGLLISDRLEPFEPRCSHAVSIDTPKKEITRFKKKKEKSQIWRLSSPAPALSGPNDSCRSAPQYLKIRLELKLKKKRNTESWLAPEAAESLGFQNEIRTCNRYLVGQFPYLLHVNRVY